MTQPLLINYQAHEGVFETILSNGYVQRGLPNKTVIAEVQDFISYMLNRSALIYSLGNLQ